MADQLPATPGLDLLAVSAGEVLDSSSLAAVAAEVAARQRSPETRRTYAAVYRTFGAFLGPDATAEAVTPAAVRAYRDWLESAGRTPATAAKHLSALRQLAAALDADPAIRTVRSASVARGEPRALSHDEFARLLRMGSVESWYGKPGYAAAGAPNARVEASWMSGGVGSGGAVAEGSVVRPWRRASGEQAEPGDAMGAQRSVERALTSVAAGVERYASQPHHRAEDLIYEAWEASGRRRAELARQALALWPDCADAYVLLAQSVSSLEQARELLERGTAAGERVLGRRVFREDVGDFWLIFETRPYMRARAALAAVLWRLGRREEAVEHQRELLRLNPRDNQGLRYRQAHWLLALESYDELEQLFAAYAEDRVPGFVYAQALAAFARRGDDACSRGLLAEARELNPHIPAYLTGRKRLPRRRSAYTVFGEESEAVDYAAGASELWGSVPGALAWLES